MPGNVRSIVFRPTFVFTENEIVLTRYMPKVKVRKEKNLLGGEAPEEVVEEEPVRNATIH